MKSDAASAAQFSEQFWSSVASAAQFSGQFWSTASFAVGADQECCCIERGVNSRHTTSYLDAMARSVADAQRAISILARELDAARAEASRLQRRTHYSIEEAADALGVSRSTICRRIADGSISSTKVGGRRLILALELELAGVA